MHTRTLVPMLLGALVSACGLPSVSKLAEVTDGTWQVIHRADTDTLRMTLAGAEACPVLPDVAAELNGSRMRVTSSGSQSSGSYYLIPTVGCAPLEFVFDAPSQVVKSGEPVVFTVHDASQSIQFRNEKMTSLELVLAPEATRRAGDPLVFELRTPLESDESFDWGDLLITREDGSATTWSYPTRTATRYSTTVPTSGPGTYNWRLPVGATVKNSWCLSQFDCAPVIVVGATFTGTFVVVP